MGRHHLEIRQDGLTSRVLLDGMDVSFAVHGVRWEIKSPGSPAQAELDLAVADVTRMSSPQTEVAIPSCVSDLLILLGWTPPESSG